ncbi:MAG: Flp pilus assembly protein CpaB [Gemmatimonadaceae bacterium]
MPARRYTVLLWSAVATAAVATVGVYEALQRTKARSVIPMRSVVVAAKDLPEGTSLGADVLTVREWPAAEVPEGAFARRDSVLGRVLVTPLFTGDVLLPGKLAPIGVGPGLEVKVPRGKRAMAVRINDVAGISGLIQPNSRVDVVVMMRQGSSTPTPVAKVFMEDLRVLSVGTTVQRDAAGRSIDATTAALEVTPEQAERLAFAATEGSIQLVLRGFGDSESVRTQGADARDVVGVTLVSFGEAAATDTATTAPRRTRAAVRRRTPPPEPAPPPSPPVPVAPPRPAPETLTVTIHRGDRTETRAFLKPDSSTPPARRNP